MLAVGEKWPWRAPWTVTKQPCDSAIAHIALTVGSLVEADDASPSSLLFPLAYVRCVVQLSEYGSTVQGLPIYASTPTPQRRKKF